MSVLKSFILDRPEVAVNTLEVGLELSGPKLILVFGPCVLDVFGWDAGGEAAEARGEIKKASEVGDAETFLTPSFVEVECFPGQSDALVVEMPFLLAQGGGAFAGEFFLVSRRAALVPRRAFEILIHTVAPWQKRSVSVSFGQFLIIGVLSAVRYVDRGALFVDTSEESTLIPVKLLGIDVAVVAFAEDLLDALEFVSHVSEVLFVGIEDAFLDGLKFDGTQSLDACIEASGPCDGRAFGDVELPGEVVEADAFGAEFDESVFRFVGVHGSVES